MFRIIFRQVEDLLFPLDKKFPADLVTFTEEILNGKLHFLCSVPATMPFIWDKVFKSEPSKISGRQPLKNLKGYGRFKQTIQLHIF